MTVWTKGVVATDHKDVFEIASVAEQALIDLIRRRAHEACPGGIRAHPEFFQNFVFPRIVMKPSSGAVEFNFTCDGAHRSLTLNFTCDCDHLDVAPRSLSMLMGASGNSELYVTSVLEALSLWGPVHFDANDSDEIDMDRLDVEPMNLLRLLGSNRLSPYLFESMVEARSALEDDAFERFVGCSRQTLKTFLETADIRSRWSQLDAFAAEKAQATAPVRRLRP